MDSLLEKLRAAAPQTRDTRDRRRRARLKDKHLVRVASGQQIPETGENLGTSEEGGDLLKPDSSSAAGGGSTGDASGSGATSEGEDIADRAASLLQGLRGDGGEGAGLSEVPTRDETGSLRIRRRRESADDERAKRRARRRGQGTGGSQDAGTTAEEGGKGVPEPIVEEGLEEKEGESEKAVEEKGEDAPTVPMTVVVPPSPQLGSNGDEEAGEPETKEENVDVKEETGDEAEKTA
jgi:cytokinesis protein